MKTDYGGYGSRSSYYDHEEMNSRFARHIGLEVVDPDPVL